MFKITDDPEDYQRARQRWDQAVAEIAATVRILAQALGFFVVFWLTLLLALAIFARA